MALYKNFYFWLESISPQVAKVGFRGVVELLPSLKNALEQFEAVLADKEQEFDKILFMNEVKKLRETLLIKKNQQHLVSNINP